MATVRFHREYKHKLDKDTTRSWPVGWAGEIADVKIAHAAVKAGAAVWVGEAPELPAEAAPVAIPDNWNGMTAGELIHLAHQLGAGAEVDTKAAAAEYVGKTAEERAAGGKLV